MSDARYPPEDDRNDFDAFTVAVAERLAADAGLVLSRVRNFGEAPYTNNNKMDFLLEAERITSGMLVFKLNPVELAEIWEKSGRVVHTRDCV